MRHFLSCSSLLILGFIFCACNNAGLQGTSIPSKFLGVKEAVAISPTSVKLSWSLQARFKEYRVYRKGFNIPDKTETFATTTIAGLSSGVYYDFSVTGVDATSGDEIGYDNFLSVKTMDNFTGVGASGLSALANGSVEVSWVKNGDGVTYKIYSKKQTDTWDLTDPVATVVGNSMGTVTNLPSGQKYCFWVVAYYQDGTYEPTNMSETYINSKAPCVLVQSQLANLPAVKMKMAFVGSLPWFWTEGGDSTYTTEIFERSTGIRWAVVNGNDYFRSIIPLAPGAKDMYAKVTSATGASTVVEVTPDGTKGLTKPLVRSLDGTSAPAPLTPRLVNGGLGLQELGSQVVVGDFNCDGLMDVAVAAPRATAVVGDTHQDATGAVVIYYGYDAPAGYDSAGNPVDPAPTLKMDVAPSADASFPNPQLIYYPDLATNTRLGQKMAVGNINGDCFSRYKDDPDDPKTNRVGLCDDLYTPTSGSSNFSAKVKKIYSCDDLAMMTNAGQVFVAFGDPVKGLVTGAGGNSYGVNETTCDPTSFKCRPVEIQDTATKDVTSIAFGDFNNDGFDDLVMGVATTSSTREVQVLRGDRMGIYPKSSTKAFPSIVAESLTTATGLSSTTGFGTLVGKSVTVDFGKAVGTAFNSRLCVNSSDSTGYTFRKTTYSGETSPAPQAVGFDFTKCDDLVIGMPSRNSGTGSILACKGILPQNNSVAGTDLQKITGWTCKESYPYSSTDDLSNKATILGYGSSILGVPNQNGYPLTNIISGSGHSSPNIGGAVFVGAPSSTVLGNVNAGVVFGYYLTPQSNSYSNGGIYGILDERQEVNAVNSVACNSRNDNVSSGSGLKHCENQALYTSPSEANVQFGAAIGTVADIEAVTRGMPSLAISAPYRSVTAASGSSTTTGGGVVYLYKPDVSTFGTEQDGTRIDVPQLGNDDTNCLTGCTWYSGGVNPYGASIIYVNTVTTNSYLGFGAAAGADFNGDGTGDLIVGAPYNSSPTYYNGAAYIFNSSGSFASAVSTPDKTINVNFSKELNYHFERAKVAGDFNGDGYQDVVSQVFVGNTVELVVYYGSANGLITSPEPSRTPTLPTSPLKLAVDLDPGFGGEFYRIGSVNGDGYDDLLVIGNKGSYIFYGSSSGIVYNTTPSVAPVGQNPLSFALADSNGAYFHNTGDTKRTMGNYVPSPLYYSSFNPKNRAVTYGDFNGDGYGDFAISTETTEVPASSVRVGSALYTTANRGRVFVFYGSKEGPQTNRTTGKVLYQDTSGNAADVVVENPCTATAVPAVCKVQMLLSTESTGGVEFGWSMAAIKSLESASGEISDELVVSDPAFSSYSGRAYLFKGSTSGLAYSPLQTIVGAKTGETFGYNVVAPGDINGDGVADLAISAPRITTTNDTGTVYIFYGGQVGSVMAFTGANTIGDTNYFGTGALAANTLNSLATEHKPQRAIPNMFVGTGEAYGVGLAAVGDINADGYADLVVNVPAKDYDLDEVLQNTGAFVVFYGGPYGLKIDASPTTTPRCYGGSNALCEPALIYLPNRQQYEYSYVSSSSAGDINGDGIPDVLLASPGRSHPSGLAFATGVVYVLY